MLSSAVPGSRVRPAPHRLLLGWASPVGTVVASDVLDLFVVDELGGELAGGPEGELMWVRWDGHRRPDRVDPADLVPATAAAAVA